MDSINKEIIRLSIPTIVSNITIPLLGICDTAISGHLGSELYLSAIAVGSVMLNVVFWIFGFLRGGTTGLTANALGARSLNEIATVLYRGLIIAFTAGIIFILFQEQVFHGLWWLTGGGNEIIEYVKNYFVIRVWGSPALLAVIVISGWFVGMQNTFYPMVIAIATNMVNIGASCLLVYEFDAGFNGVAIGTLISNWAGLLISVGCMFWFLKGKIMKCSLRNLIHGNWWKYFAVNGNLFLRSLFIICVTMGVTAAGAKLGPLTLAVNLIVMQFFQFFSFFMDGFAYSGEAMIGLRAGERNYEALKKCVKRLLTWSLGTCVTFAAIYFFLLNDISNLLTDQPNVVEGVLNLTVFIAMIPLVSCWSFIYDGFYIGITDTYKMMISTLIGGISFFLVISIDYFEPDFPVENNKIIWSAFLSYLMVRGLYLATMWPAALKKSFADNHDKPERVSEGVSPNCSR